ncbi:MAG: hypothetical protein ACRD6R_13715 [Candidatus Polarisedimenticolia bacterium]
MNRETRRFIRPLAITFLAGLLWTASGPPARAGSFDYLFSVSHVGNDDQYFLNFTVSNSGYGRAVLEPVLPRLRYVETDLPVVLFLARHSRRPVEFIVDLRAGGLGWSIILGRLNLAPSILFAGIDRDPGPPYGKAWGYWRKNPRGARFSDADIVGLVQVQTAARHAGLSAFELARGRGQGRKVSAAVADTKGRPWKGKPERAHGGPDKGKPKGQGHGKPPGN